MASQGQISRPFVIYPEGKPVIYIPWDAFLWTLCRDCPNPACPRRPIPDDDVGEDFLPQGSPFEASLDEFGLPQERPSEAGIDEDTYS